MSLITRRIIVFSLALAGIAAGTFLVIKFAQGYRPDLTQKNLQLQATGLLVATSDPDGAQLWIDNKLKTATNNTINLPPGSYTAEIKKDGYSNWKKQLEIKKELVTQADAYLFTSFPDLKGMTFTGAEEPKLSPDGQRIAYRVTGTSTMNQGIWVLDLVDRPLGLNREPRQVLTDAAAEYRWTPDSKQLIVIRNRETFLADASKPNPPQNLVNITLTLSSLEEQWQAEAKLKEEAKIIKLPEKLAEILQEKAAAVIFSPDETKVMYTATASAEIPENLLPQLPAASTQKQERKLEKGKIYVYDLKEDRNFYITNAPETSPPNKPINNKEVLWFPTSKHIFIVQNDKISIGEYDGTNWLDVYTGPFVNSFAFPFPSGGRVVVLTSIGKDTPTNLYAIGLK
ncbi:MAG: PEGA domain-containing protein [Candidatus Shapirobacteria bacterium]